MRVDPNEIRNLIEMLITALELNPEDYEDTPIEANLAQLIEVFLTSRGIEVDYNYN